MLLMMLLKILKLQKLKKEVNTHITIDYTKTKETEILALKLSKDLSLYIPSIILMYKLDNTTSIILYLILQVNRQVQLMKYQKHFVQAHLKTL